MNEEDFGFEARDRKVLENVLVGPTNEEKKREKGAGENEGEVSGGAVTGGYDRDVGVQVQVNKSGGDNGSFSRGEEGRVGGGIPETGSGVASVAVEGNAEQSSLVAGEPPSIPNVVEYHLKVKSTGNNSGEKSRNIDPGRLSFGKRIAKPEVGKRFASGESSGRKIAGREPSRMALDNNNRGLGESSELPQTFQVKYLGSHDARGLWGIKHTRKPVDNMVSAARSLPAGTILPFVKLVVSKDGVGLLPLGLKRHDAGISKKFSIDTISYGVQDLVYTRVFSMIVVRETGQNQGISPFECHGFVCESRNHARQLTYALANAFQIYSQSVKAQGKAEETAGNIKKRFAIDLRTPEEIEAELTLDSEA
ncbi:uncharacterized protein LOC105687238 [Athalia rosae]|uniref:uncharacterized protein LOC105687238 n=1 Tax=Athalia rosae TaxID=37344 RepID=UPI002033E538|nr:uncharacterized protein LOC105687238 [Athalia rosae]